MPKTILHVAKWFPNPEDPQNGVFVEKHINSTAEDPHYIAFVDFAGPPIERKNGTIYGARVMSATAKFAVFVAKFNQLKPDLVHFHCFTPDIVPMAWWCKKDGTPYIHSEHWSGFLPDNLDKFSLHKRSLASWYFRSAERVLPVSSILAKGIKSISPKAKITVLPNIVDGKLDATIEKRPVKSFCVVADIHFSNKKQDLLLEVFKMLDRVKFEMHFYGGGPDLERLKKLASPMLNVFVHGRKTNAEILEALPQHHALILFSNYETFGITPLEARKAGLWAIMKPTFGAADYADEGCLMANNEVELVEQMEKAMAMPLPGPAAFEELSSESIGNRLNELYESLN